MDQSVLFVVDNDRLHHFAARAELGADVVSVLQSDLGVTVGETVLPIAHWEHDRTGPLSVAVNFAGELVVLVVADTFTNKAVLLNTLSTLEQWLAPMDLADLGELSGDPDRFHEGLSELSPRTPLVLASMMRFLLINPTLELTPATISANLPFSKLEVLQIETLEAADGTLAIRRAHERSDSLGDTVPINAGMPITIHLDSEPKERGARYDDPLDNITVLDDEVEDVFADERAHDQIIDAEEVDDAHEDVAEADEVAHIVVDEHIDLTQPPHHASGLRDVAVETTHVDTESPADLTNERPTIIRGSQYVTAELPLHFDPTGSRIESISDELFAVGPHLSLIVDLDDCDQTPIETGSIFRWDSTPGQRELFSWFEIDASGHRRTIHVFVESSTGPNRVFYLGTASQLAQSDRSLRATMWFKLSAPIDGRWLSALQSGTIPRQRSQEAREETTESAAIGDPGNWVRNV